jgi:hypothetical protein
VQPGITNKSATIEVDYGENEGKMQGQVMLK